MPAKPQTTVIKAQPELLAILPQIVALADSAKDALGFWPETALREAITRSEAALEATVQHVRVGMTEKHVEAILLRELFAAGCDGLSFDPIVAAGDNVWGQ